MDDTRDDASRRTVIRQGACALAAAAGLGSFVSLKFLAPWPRERASRALVVGYPEEIEVGSIIALSHANIFVGRTADGFYALSSVCPHLGCVVRWLDDLRRFHCPCHGSQFEPDGHVLNGPAREDLVPLDVGVDDQGRIVVEGSA